MNNFAQKAQKIKLDKESIYLRKLIFICLKSHGRGHLGPAFSIVEILRVLYSKYIKKNKSKFILSKGHGCLALYAMLYQHGYIKKVDLLNTGKFNSILGGHPEHQKIPGVEVSTGSLGHGLPIAVGMAIGSKLKTLPVIYKTSFKMKVLRLKFFVNLPYQRLQVLGVDETLFKKKPTFCLRRV